MPKIEIESEFCKGCLFCVEACPKDVIGTTSAVNNKGYQSPFRFILITASAA